MLEDEHSEDGCGSGGRLERMGEAANHVTLVDTKCHESHIGRYVIQSISVEGKKSYFSLFWG